MTKFMPIGAVALRDELRRNMTREVGEIAMGERCATLRLGGDSLWAIIEGPKGLEAALRCGWAPGARMEVKQHRGGEIRLLSSFGDYRISIDSPAPNIIHVVTRLTPAFEFEVPWWPRDLYILAKEGDPAKAKGEVFAAQRGYNAAVVYGKIDPPINGTFFYIQDLTSLNGFFNRTNTKPDGAVGGEWPELGYQIPAFPHASLEAGKEMTLSDAYLRLGSKPCNDPRTEGRLFLQHLSAIYPFLDRPDPKFHDWPAKAEATLESLESDLATVVDAGYKYVRPYVGAEPPDSMAQVALLLAIHEYGKWRGEPHPMEAELRAGVYRFFSPEIGAVRRYLDTVGPDKDPDEVDSWYLCHPLRSLAALAKHGDEGAWDLFTASLDYAVHAAQHFDYTWPIKFSLKNFEVKTLGRSPGEAGQTDAGGLYAYVMLDAFDLTGDKRYLEEAKHSIRAMKDMHFEVAYQTNLTSWGAVACLRLWRQTGEKFFFDEAAVLLSSLFHNSVIWQSRIGRLDDVNTFLGVTCLHNAPYLAPFECYESFWAAQEILDLGREDLPEEFRLLSCEFWRYALDRLWWFYPSSLKESWIAHTTRSGQIVRALEFPVEDLYVDGQPVGQVGQEIYGAGAALAVASRAFHRLPGGGYLFCDYPLAERHLDERGFGFSVHGHPDFSARARVIGRSGATVTVGDAKVEADDFLVQPGQLVEVRLS
ncbi:MAG TPA: hypothetical protein VG944_19265 [Fimbriimonas sp.]|nr:hypothetical protein [Fimbriimonas sp.]